MVKLSVIIPAYNKENKILKTLDSIANQSFRDLEIIVVDDGSTDNTKNVIEKYIQEKNDDRIKLLSKENGGLSSARNYGVKFANRKIYFIYRCRRLYR